MLANGNCVFTISSYDNSEESSAAFFHSYRDNSTWNVLEGVQRPADRESVENTELDNNLRICLFEGFGTDSPVVLCFFQHNYYGVQLSDNMTGIGMQYGLRPEWRKPWRCALVLTSSGNRYMTNLFDEGQLTDHIWLHNSGLLISGFVEHGGIRLLTHTLHLAE